MNTVSRLWSSAVNSVRRKRLSKRLGRVVIEQIDDAQFVVLPTVFNPNVFRTGAFMAETLATSPFAAPPAEGARVDAKAPLALDMGTGSGVGAVFAARRGYDVVAVDINPDAVRCARINSLLNGREEQIEVRCGDLFEPINGRLFDLVLFNPPFFRGDPKDSLDAAWRGTDVIERFAEGLPRVQKPGGRALILMSTDGEEQPMLRALRKAGMEVETAVQRDYGNELLSVHCARRQRGPVDESLLKEDRERPLPFQNATVRSAGQQR